MLFFKAILFTSRFNVLLSTCYLGHIWLIVTLMKLSLILHHRRLVWWPYMVVFTECWLWFIKLYIVCCRVSWEQDFLLLYELTCFLRQSAEVLLWVFPRLLFDDTWQSCAILVLGCVILREKEFHFFLCPPSCAQKILISYAKLAQSADLHIFTDHRIQFILA